MADVETKAPPEEDAEGQGPEVAEQEELSPEELRAELERMREELRSMRRWERKAKRLERELEELKSSSPTAPASEPPPMQVQTPDTPDAERAKIAARLAEAQAKIAALEQERVEALLKSAVVAEASRVGFEHPEDVWRFVDRSQLELDDETGEVHGVEEAVRDVAKKRPRWLRAAGIGVGKAGGAGSETDEQRRARLFGGASSSPFWKGSGVVIPENQ